MAVEERQLNVCQHQCGLARQCLHQSISAIERCNNLTPEVFQQLPVRRTGMPVRFHDQDSTGDTAVVVKHRDH